MPTPVGHSLVGYAIYRATNDRPAGRRRWVLPLLYVLAANAADLDFVPGFLVGEPNQYHRGISHSVGLAVLFAVVFGPVLAWVGGGGLRRAVVIAFVLYASHVVVDCFNVDTAPPFGVRLFWPMSSAYYIAPVPLLLDVHRSGASADFVPSLFSAHNAQTIAVELLVFVSLLGLVLAWRRRAGWRRLKPLARE